MPEMLGKWVREVIISHRGRFYIKLMVQHVVGGQINPSI